ncbi:MAG: cytochrome c oxidase subunit II [Rickettsiaceae bacterium]|nr:cytochrome c oxidase subunit II [Rickettsiaceae bacterium]
MIRFLILLFLLLIGSNCKAAYPLDWQMDFQPAASEIMEELVWFHDFLMVISVAIVAFVFFLLMYVIFRFSAKRNPVPAKFSHNITIEVIWTVIPIIILIIIAIPSFRILKFAEKIPPAEMTIKVVGYQWYWGYEYPDHENIAFDSNIIPDNELKPGQLRLLEVDNRIVIPENTTVKFLITAGDVIHSFAIPALGIKTDAVPGKINETWTKVSKRGVYYGQCSEICGVNHGFMPIALEVVSKEEFAAWVEQAKEKFASNNSYYNLSKIKLAENNNK